MKTFLKMFICLLAAPIDCWGQTMPDDPAVLLQNAVIAGDIVGIKKLLKEPTEVDVRDKNGQTPLMQAVMMKGSRYIQLLPIEGAQWHEVLINGETICFYSTKEGYQEMVDFLQDMIDNRYKSVDETAADFAPIDPKTYLKISRLLLNHGANVNAGRQDGMTALMLAAREGKLDFVRLLLKHKANVNARDNFGQTPLLLALQYNHIEIAKLLLDKGANAMLKDRVGTTSLMHASRLGDLEMVQVLLQKEVDVNALIIDGPMGMRPASALMLAAAVGDPEIIQLLLKHGAKPDIQDSYGRTALIWAVKENRVPAVIELFRGGAGVHIHNVNGDTALWYAATSGYEDIVRLLIERKAKVDNMGHRHSSDTPLIAASTGGYLPVVQLLLDNGADVNAKASYSEETALIRASRQGHLDIVRLLLERGAQVNAKDALEGHTALYWARREGHREIAAMLASKGAESIENQ